MKNDEIMEMLKIEKDLDNDSQIILLNIRLEKFAVKSVNLNKKLTISYKENAKLTSELAFANSELEKTERIEKEYMLNLEEIMFIISHKVRKSVANILGISYFLEDNENCTSDDLKPMLKDIVQSATSLNTFTDELSTLVHTKRHIPHTSFFAKVNILSQEGQTETVSMIEKHRNWARYS